MTAAPTIRIPYEALRDLYSAIFVAAGMPDDLATIPADVLLEADLVGNPTHGIRRVPSYLARIRAGGTTASARPLVSEDDGVVRVDGRNAPGQVVAHLLMDTVAARAAERGYCLGFAHDSNHVGALGYYPQLAARRGQLGLFVSGVASNLAPTGGSRAVLGNNPWAVAIPYSRFPLVIDIAPGVTIIDHLIAAEAQDGRIPPGWGLDDAGLPTESASEARRGSILPAGGHKGYLLALLLEVLASVMSGAAFGPEIPGFGETHRPKRLGHFALALRTDLMVPAEDFDQRIERLVSSIHGQRAAPGAEPPRVPGERAAVRRADGRRNGVEVPRDAWATLSQEARRLGVTPPDSNP
jgi:LDH2 family malate/lactate/ureidoglycolate dehydrogenase